MNELRFLVLALSITWSVSAGAQEAWHFHLLGSPPWIEPLPSSSRAIHDLTPYQGKLYISYGDAGDNLGPVELGNYEPASNAFTTQYLLGSEATGRYKVMGESLYVPSIDPAHFYNQSDFAVMTEDGWKRQAQIGMLHAYDIVSYEGNLYMAGSSREVIESAGSNALIWRSEDMGKRWMPWFRTFQDARAVGRSHYVMPYQNRLYYLVRYLEGNDITVQEDSGLDLTIDVYELFLDKIVYKVGASGELGSLGPRTIATFDGTSATSLEMETLDIFVDGDRLWALLDGPRIAWTEDLETWINVNASALPERAHRLACLGDQLFVATRDGELWLGGTDAAQEAPDAPSVVRMRGDDVGQDLAWDDDRLLVSAPAAGQAPWNHGQVELRTPAATSLLQSPEPLPLGYFGAHVAVDGNWLAVSEPKRDDAKVHVYYRTTSEAAWAWQQTLVYEQLRGQGRESRPLHSVDLWGDYLAVGWEGQADRSSEPAFTLYEWQDETWKSVFAASYASIDTNLDSEAYIRTQVALDEDLLVIGLVGDPADNKGQGLVVIYERVESGWQRQQVILAPEAAMVSEFGIALALSESWLG